MTYHGVSKILITTESVYDRGEEWLECQEVRSWVRKKWQLLNWRQDVVETKLDEDINNNTNNKNQKRGEERGRGKEIY